MSVVSLSVASLVRHLILVISVIAYPRTAMVNATFVIKCLLSVFISEKRLLSLFYIPFTISSACFVSWVVAIHLVLFLLLLLFITWQHKRRFIRCSSCLCDWGTKSFSLKMDKMWHGIMVSREYVSVIIGPEFHLILFQYSYAEDSAVITSL